MKTYARIDNGIVTELFETDGDIAMMFNPLIVWVDVTGTTPAVQERWLATETGGTWSFNAPAGESLAQVKAEMCAMIDMQADTAYIAIGGPSPGRLAEYQQANTDAAAFKAAGYTGTVPPTVACWSTASGMTAQAAADNILATAALWMGVLNGVRSARLLGKKAVNDAATVAEAQAAGATAIANIAAAASGA